MSAIQVQEAQGARSTGILSVRVAALAGAVYFALIIGFSQLTSGSPSATDAGTEILDWLQRNQGRMQLAAVLLGFAMPAALMALSGLFRALSNAERTPGFAYAALGGGVLAAATTVIGALVVGTTAARIDDLDAAQARVWWTMFFLSLGATLLGLFLLIAATAVVCLARNLFPRWFGLASIVLALLSAVGAWAIGFDTTGILAVAGIAVLADSVWILLVSIFLWRHPELALPGSHQERPALG
jgi:hypothetical protein